MVDGPATIQQFIRDSLNLTLRVAGASPLPSTSVPPRSGPLDIAIPIFNSVDMLRLCLDSLLPTLTDGDQVWLLDDASTELEVPVLMDDFSRQWPATKLLRNAENRGFVATSNRAFAATQRDIVLLNSDTEVAHGWLEYLQSCLLRNPLAGIICPLSDRATILSVLPAGDSNTRIAIAAAAAASTIGDVPLPTAVGFCMLIRRELLNDIGDFSQAFAPGYGEENDLSMRALRAGWHIIACDQACVYHRSGGSFSQQQSSTLQLTHQKALDRLWPEYGPLVQSWWRDNPLRAKAESMVWQGDNREGILHVLHRQYHVGGTERATRTLIEELGENYRHTLLYPGKTAGTWCDYELQPSKLCRELMLNQRWIRPSIEIARYGADLTCQHSEAALARIVLGSKPGIVHFHHMLQWDSLLLPAVARALGCRTVISVHDFWFNCPVYNQLEHHTGQPCGRSHVQDDARCSSCLHGYKSSEQNNDPPDQQTGVYTQARHALIQQMLQDTDAVFVPSQFIRNRLLKAYPLVPPEQFRVVLQGVALPDQPASAGRGSRRVLAYFGGDQVLKGAALVLHMARSLPAEAATFRIYGRIKGFDAATLPANVELRGFYSPDNVSQAMEGVDLALLPSHYEESFSMVASECWAHGVPLLGSARGALAERVVPGINGWLVADMAPESWVRALRSVLDGDAIERCRAQLSGYSVTTIEQSAATVHDVYQQLLLMPVPLVEQTAPGDPLARFRKKLGALRSTTRPRARKSTGNACLGILRDHWGTANYRVRFPLEDLAQARACESSHFHVVRQAGFQVAPVLGESGARHVAIQPFLSDEGLKLMEYLHRETGLHITLVVDDLWTALAADNPVRTLMPDDVPGRLSYAASLSQSLVLTTHELQRKLGITHHNTHVINNTLPDWIWGSLHSEPNKHQRRLRIGWSGAPQHAGDLVFLDQVMKETADLADWVFLGMCPDTLRPLASEFHGIVPFDRYPSALSALGLDLAIAPLAAHEFNRCKSHLKVLEYGILGLPVIACDLEPYRHCPVTFAAADNAEDWVDKIRSLLGSQEARLEQGKALRQWVLDNHMTQHSRTNWRKALGIKTHAY